MRKTMVFAALCAACCWLAPSWAQADGTSPCAPGTYALRDMHFQVAPTGQEKPPAGASAEGKQGSAATGRLVIDVGETQCALNVPSEFAGKFVWYARYKGDGKGGGSAVQVSVKPDKPDQLAALLLCADFPAWGILGIMALAGVVVLLIASYAAKGTPSRFLCGTDGLYSNSQCQLALWFGATVIAYATVVAVRALASGGACWAGVGIPNNLLLLSGMSAFTFGAAKGIATHQEATEKDAAVKSAAEAKDVAAKEAQKATEAARRASADAVELKTRAGAAADPTLAAIVATAQAAVQKTVAAAEDAGKTLADKAAALDKARQAAAGGKGAGAASDCDDKPRPEPGLANLFTDSCGRLDLGDFQMILISGFVVLVFLATVVVDLRHVSLETAYMLPDVDGSMLSAFGLGQGAYLVKKLATPLGRG